MFEDCASSASIQAANDFDGNFLPRKKNEYFCLLRPVYLCRRFILLSLQSRPEILLYKLGPDRFGQVADNSFCENLSVSGHFGITRR